MIIQIWGIPIQDLIPIILVDIPSQDKKIKGVLIWVYPHLLNVLHIDRQEILLCLMNILNLQIWIFK